MAAAAGLLDSIKRSWAKFNRRPGFGGGAFQPGLLFRKCLEQLFVLRGAASDSRARWKAQGLGCPAAPRHQSRALT